MEKVEFTGKITGLSRTIKGKPVVAIEIDESMLEHLEQFGEDVVDVKISKPRKKRSLNANGYLWALINEIANVLRSGKNEVYLQMLKRYGQSDAISVIEEVPIGCYVKYYDEIGTAVLNGKKFVHYKCYKGSSEYDSREFAILLDGVIDEAKELGIQVLTESEVQLLKDEYDNAR